jgi:glycerate kinase
MRVLVAPDKLKGSLSATDAADAIAQGILAADPEAQIDLCPIADGGEGTVAALLKANGGRLITRTVTGPLPEMKVDASFAILADHTTAVIEMSAASGLALLEPEDRNPLYTTTFGTGELIAAAINAGAKKILLGLGGSATIDAGIGLAQACGFTILTKNGEPVRPTEPLCGRDLSNILLVKHGRGEITNGIEIIALTDVTNPLCGATGAAKIFGPQKGATAEIAEQLDTDLRELASRTDIKNLAEHPGAGAAGGLGFGVLAFLHGSITNGFDFIADAVRISQRLKNTDLCFTAEGRLDSQTHHGKSVAGIARLCDSHKVPCIALVGSAEFDMQLPEGLTAYFGICNQPMRLDDAMAGAAPLLKSAAENCVRLWTTSSFSGCPEGAPFDARKAPLRDSR